jgi:2-hydroxy-3-keto-5-methylthiopentenyl-1-phosphate phosphatase
MTLPDAGPHPLDGTADGAELTVIPMALEHDHEEVQPAVIATQFSARETNVPVITVSSGLGFIVADVFSIALYRE